MALYVGKGDCAVNVYYSCRGTGTKIFACPASCPVSVTTKFSIMIDPRMYGSSQSGAVIQWNNIMEMQTFTSLEFTSQ